LAVGWLIIEGSNLELIWLNSVIFDMREVRTKSSRPTGGMPKGSKKAKD